MDKSTAVEPEVLRCYGAVRMSILDLERQAFVFGRLPITVEAEDPA
ncbi:MAG: hypothetical protein ABJH85_00510 [Paracoccaceae bacterium]